MKAIEKLIGKEVIARSDRAGVFFGELNEVEKNGDKLYVELKNCRRLWYWNGACSISQLANEGTKRPEDCKFAQNVTSIVISGVIEIIPTTSTASEIIKEVPSWEK